MKNTEELKKLAALARKKGFKVSKAQNGGGWMSLAIACGSSCTTKIQAKEFLLSLFKPSKQSSRLDAGKKRSDATRFDYVNSDAFLASYEWRVLRMKVLTKYGARCMCCGATAADGVRIHVDHIKCRRRHPRLALVFENLQVLCEECNHGKSNWDETDWRFLADQHMKDILKPPTAAREY